MHIDIFRSFLGMQFTHHASDSATNRTEVFIVTAYYSVGCRMFIPRTPSVYILARRIRTLTCTFHSHQDRKLFVETKRPRR